MRKREPMQKVEPIQAGRLTCLAAAVGVALAGALASAIRAEAAEPAADRCFGVAKVGENDCADAAGTHACAGLATEAFSGGEWKLVPAGTCLALGGRPEPFEGTGGGQ